MLKACHEAKVRRVIVVSSGSAVFNNPNWPKGKVLDEDSWSDPDLCRKNEVSKAVPSHLSNLDGRLVYMDS